MAFFQDLPCHDGEIEMKKAMRAPRDDNPTYPTLSPQLSNHLQIAPLIAIGTVDKQGRPWTTLWGGHSGLSQPLGQGIIGIKTEVSSRHDPVLEELVGTEATGSIVREEGQGRMVSGLTIDLETRKRVKLYGRMVAGALMSREDEVQGTSQQIAEVQLVLKIEQSLGNCPKYLNKKHMVPGLSDPKIEMESPQLSQKAINLLAKSDLFFMSSSQHGIDMDTNHRGGPAGFVRVVSNQASGAVLCYPEYSGNRLYQTLGNLKVNPKTGLCVPDFDTGDMLYLTGNTEILIGPETSRVLTRSNLAVKITVTAARFVTSALCFRGSPGEASPYNPNIRFLASEKHVAQSQDGELSQAKLLSQTSLTPTISRFKFALTNATRHRAGQYVTLDFSSSLDMGYSHMRDDDPRSLNDDFVRTFTVSSPPSENPHPTTRLKDDEFEITVRRVGAVTEELFKHKGAEQGDRMPLEIGVKGFGGEFEIRQEEGKEEMIAFIAAGVGISPILPSLRSMDLTRLKLLWTVKKADLGLVEDTIQSCPQLQQALTLFVTNLMDDDATAKVPEGVVLHRRRLTGEDVRFGDEVRRYYLCTATSLKNLLTEWLPDKELVYEDFNY